MSGKENVMKIEKEERIRLTPAGYKAICAMVDRRASREVILGVSGAANLSGKWITTTFATVQSTAATLLRT